MRQFQKQTYTIDSEKALTISTSIIDIDSTVVNLHVYSIDDIFITSIYNLSSCKFANINGTRAISLDIHNDARNAGFYSGKYKLKYTFEQNVIGTANDPLFIRIIDSTRTSIQLIPERKDQSTYNKIDSVILSNQYNYELNLFDNTYSNIIDVAYNTRAARTPKPGEFQVTLEEPLPLDYDINSKVFITHTLSDPIEININLIPSDILSQVNILRQPNFSIKINKETQSSTDYRSYNDIINVSSASYTNFSLSDYAMQTYSGSKSNGTNLNIDYSDFINFVYYGNAKARIDNFIYKVIEIENYENDINNLLLLNSGSSSLASTNDIISAYQSKTNIINKFDPYEEYMYFESRSHDELILSEYESIPWPKNTDVKPYGLYSYSSSQFISWKESIVPIAEDYDLKNIYSLEKILPEYVSMNIYNSDFTKLIYLTGQYFDSLKLYADNLLSTTNRSEDINTGMVKNLIYDVLISYGWKPENTVQFDELWKYSYGIETDEPIGYDDFILGYEEDGIFYHPITVDDIFSSFSKGPISSADYMNEIWKRILNNLPYLNKTKGTLEGLRSLSNCYGIPDTLIKFKEYGGPEKLNTDSSLEYNKYNYALHLSNQSGSNGIIAYVPVSQSAECIEFRIKLDPDYPVSQSLYSNPMLNTYLHVNSSSILELGNNVSSVTGSYIDSSWYNYMINIYYNGSNYTHDVYYSNNHEFIQSASLTSNVFLTGSVNQMHFCRNSFSVQTPFYGSIQEIKLWNATQSLDVFKQHIQSPSSYNGINESASFYNLIGRLPLGSDNVIQPFDSSGSTFFTSIVPNYTPFLETPGDSSPVSGNTVFVVMTSEDNYNYNSNYEIHNTVWPDISSNRSISNKIRIEDNYLEGNLDISKAKEVSSYDSYPNDSAKVGAYFSITNEINQDIAYQMGGVNIDDYIGSWTSTYDNSYMNLHQLQKLYTQKYVDADINQYNNLLKYYNKSIFNHIKEIVPVRSNLVTGLVVESHVLDRSKVKIINREPEFENIMLDSNIMHDTNLNTGASILDYYTSLNTNSTIIYLSGSTLQANIDQYKTSNKINSIILDPLIYGDMTEGTYAIITGGTTSKVYITTKTVPLADITSPVTLTIFDQNGKYIMNCHVSGFSAPFEEIDLIETIDYSIIPAGSFISLNSVFNSRLTSASASDMRSKNKGLINSRYKGCGIPVSSSLYTGANKTNYPMPGIPEVSVSVTKLANLNDF